MQTAFGQYELLAKLAEGGMGEVFVARIRRDDGFRRVVALKRMHPAVGEDAAFAAQFVAEARTAAALHCANIVQVLDFGREDGRPFVAMEYVDGADAAALVAAHPSGVPPAAVAELARGLLRALDHLARAAPSGLVHQDISPSNVLLSREGDVKLGDFGLVRAAARANALGSGRQGKPSWMAPEQLACDAVSPAADLYAAGLVMLTLLAGANPLVGAGDGRLDRASRLRAAVAALPEAARPFAGLIAELTDDDAAARPTAAAAMGRLDRLRSALPEGPGLRELTAHLPGRPPPGRFAEAERTMVARTPIREPAGVPLDGPAPAAPARFRRAALAAASVALAATAAVVGVRIGVPGRATIINLPAEAAVTADGAPVAHSGGRAVVPAGATVVVRMAGRRTVTLLPAQTVAGGTTAVDLRPAYGTIRIESEPPGATIEVDTRRGDLTTPTLLEFLPLGRQVTLTLRLEGHVPFTAAVTPADETPVIVRHRFEALFLRRRLVVSPPAATLFVDGRRVGGRSPFDLGDLVEGRSYTVEAHAPGRRPVRSRFTADRSGDPPPIDLPQLTPVLRVRAPDGAGMSAAGRPAPAGGVPMPPDKPLTLTVELPGGRLTLRLVLSVRAGADGRTTGELRAAFDAAPWAEIDTPAGTVTTPAAARPVGGGTEVQLRVRFGGAAPGSVLALRIGGIDPLSADDDPR